jgi:hypothetical protein
MADEKIKQAVKLLKEIKVNLTRFFGGEGTLTFELVDQVLQLLQCPTCGGSGEVWRKQEVATRAYTSPCPDCQEPDHIPEAGEKVEPAEASEITKESLAIELYDAYQTYRMSRYTNDIGISWDMLSNTNKECWLAAVNPACEIIENLKEEFRIEKDANAVLIKAKESIANENEGLRDDYRKMKAKLEKAESKRHISLTQAREMALFECERGHERQKWINAQETIKQLQAQLAEQKRDKGDPQ